MENKQAQIQLEKARALLLSRSVMTYSMLFGLETELTTKVPSMATDAKRWLLNPEWLEKTAAIDIASKACMVAGALALHHPFRRGSREPQLFGQASEQVLGHFISEYGFDPDCMIDPRFDGLTVEEVYKILKEESQSQDQSEDQEDQSEDQEEQGQDQDQSQPDNSPQGSQPQQSGSEEPGEGSDDGEGEGQGEGSSPVYGVCIDAEGDAPNQANQMAQLTIRAIDAAQREKNLNPGSASGDMVERMRRLATARNNQWEQLLDAMTSPLETVSTYYPANAYHIWRDEYLPSQRPNKVKWVDIVIDSSGSMTKEELQVAGENLSSILENVNPERVRLRYIDTVLKGAEEYTQADLPLTLDVKGRGGTDYKPAFELDQFPDDEKPDYLVYFTDLDVTAHQFPTEEPQFPVIWAWTGNQREHIKVPFGQVLKINLKAE